MNIHDAVLEAVTTGVDGLSGIELDGEVGIEFETPDVDQRTGEVRLTTVARFDLALRLIDRPVVPAVKLVNMHRTQVCRPCLKTGDINLGHDVFGERGLLEIVVEGCDVRGDECLENQD